MKDKSRILELRNRGWGYGAIAIELGISRSSVSSYCQRHKLDEEKEYILSSCKNCGKPVELIPHQKQRQFCSPLCRQQWWNNNQDKVNKKANYNIVCKCCGTSFVSYGNKDRKYCSHDCYIKARYNGDVHE